MRDILFRGMIFEKTFVQGDLAHDVWCTGDCYIQGRDHTGKSFSHAVYPETVGQFIAMRDKNNVPIFEGDIVAAHLDERYPENETRCLIVWDDTDFRWVMRQYRADGSPLLDCSIDRGDSAIWAVIGNVFENKDLLTEV